MDGWMRGWEGMNANEWSGSMERRTGECKTVSTAISMSHIDKRSRYATRGYLPAHVTLLPVVSSGLNMRSNRAARSGLCRMRNEGRGRGWG